MEPSFAIFTVIWDVPMKKIRMHFDISNPKFTVLTPTRTDKPKNSNFNLTVALKFPSERL